MHSAPILQGRQRDRGHPRWKAHVGGGHQNADRLDVPVLPVRAGCIAVAPKNSIDLVVLSNLHEAS